MPAPPTSCSTPFDVLARCSRDPVGCSLAASGTSTHTLNSNPNPYPSHTENVDLWLACALRYAGHHLAIAELAAQQAQQGGAEPAAPPSSPLQQLVDTVAEPLPDGGCCSAGTSAGFAVKLR